MACRPRVGRILTPFGFRFRCSRVVGWGLEGLTARAMRLILLVQVWFSCSYSLGSGREELNGMGLFRRLARICVCTMYVCHTYIHAKPAVSCVRVDGTLVSDGAPVLRRESDLRGLCLGSFMSSW